MLTIRDLDAGYGKLQILRSVTLTLRENETVALIGANGSGKTTVLKAIMNMVQVMNGEIIFDNISLNDKPWYKIAQLGISFVPQTRQVFAPLTVLENLEVGAYRIRKKGKTNTKKILHMVLDFFPHLKPRLSQIAGYMSGGEQRMLSIARGLMSDPKILLLDEPSLGLAPNLASDVFETIEKVASEYPSLTGVMIVEQNAYLALEIATRGYVLENGMVVLEGTSEELCANPEVKKAYLAM